MKRAQDTADYIIGNRNILHLHHKGLNELNFGLWEGKMIADLINHPEYQQNCLSRLNPHTINRNT